MRVVSSCDAGCNETDALRFIRSRQYIIHLAATEIRMQICTGLVKYANNNVNSTAP